MKRNKMNREEVEGWKKRFDDSFVDYSDGYNSEDKEGNPVIVHEPVAHIREDAEPDAIKDFIIEIVEEEKKSILEGINEVLDTARGVTYPYQDYDERLRIIIEGLSKLTNKEK